MILDNLREQTPFQIIEMTENHTGLVAEIHLRELSSSVLSRLGISFLKDFYYRGLVSINGFKGFVILWEKEVVGFIALSLEPERVFRRLMTNNLRILVMSLIRGLLSDKGTIRAILEAARFFLSSGRPVDSGLSEILSFAVPVRFRSREFYSQSKLKPGNELFLFALGFLKKMNKKKTFLMVDAQNAPARIFYRNMGMKETGSKKYFGLDCLKCEKVFDDS